MADVSAATLTARSPHDAPTRLGGAGEAAPRRVAALWLWGPVLLQMALIFGASSLSDPGPIMPPGLTDKGGHFIGYVLLSMLVLRALAGGRLRGITWRKALLAIVLSSLYGVSDEFHQSFVPGRSPDIHDIAADTLGACASAAVGSLAGVFARRQRRDAASARV